MVVRPASDSAAGAATAVTAVSGEPAKLCCISVRCPRTSAARPDGRATGRENATGKAVAHDAGLVLSMANHPSTQSNASADPQVCNAPITSGPQIMW